MNKLENIETPRLVAYLNIFDNLYQTNTQLINSANELVYKGNCKIEDLDDIVSESQLARQEALDISAAIQKELDKRIKKDLNVQFGIRRCQTILGKFEDRIVSLQRKENDKMAEEYKKLKVEDANTSEQ